MTTFSATRSDPLDEASPLIDVAICLPIFSTFTYRAGPDLLLAVAPGKRVLVPFGRRRITGYILGEARQAPQAGIKNIAAILDEHSLFPEVMLDFFKWVADYYMHPLGEVLQTALPSGINLADEISYELAEIEDPTLAAVRAAMAPWEQRLFERLSQGACSRGALRRLAGRAFAPHVLGTWEKKGWIVRRENLAGGATRAKSVRYVAPHPAFIDGSRLSPARQAIWQMLQAQGPMAMQTLRAAIPSAAALVRSMVRDGQAVLELRAVYRDPLGEPIAADRPPPLTPEQTAAVDTMAAQLGQGYQTFLLAGVTGSGKTEVYLQMAARALAQNLSVLVLVPEIALISQTERAFRARFGERVALLHSGLSDGERLDQWQRILAGEAAIAVGARSAIFAPFAKIGLIIVDEEHDDAYKQEGALRYNARDLAVMRARQQDAVAILGSATPSLQSAYNAQNGKFQKISLFERVDQRAMPEILIQDLTAMREERGVRRHLTPALLQALGETLARKEQALIFLNRRGFAGTVVCAACGQTLRCRRCDISLTYHQQANAYQCHYCGFCQPAVARCPRCGSDRVRRLGLGTERLEEDLRKLFPTARVGRMDRDTTRRKGSLLKILKDLHDRKIDILVGTQMVAKGHDYPHITLVGIICADLSLSMPDFRAGERTFQLLAQVAGRAGRGKVPGRVILQTFNPYHFSITAARQQDFEAFYRQEIECRKLLGYPPVTRMIQLRISGRDKAQVTDLAQRLGAQCRQRLTQTPADGLEVLGPIEAPLQRIADHYRWQLLIKGPRVGPLHQFVRRLLFGPDAITTKGDVAVAVDVDPVFLM